MKNMKKLWALLLALAMVLSLAACGGTSDGETATDDQTTEDTATDETTETDSDLAYVQDKGSLVVGITYFAPMDYKAEGSDEWIGFDADLAKLFAESLGVSVEFQEITWDYKVEELNSRAIDCVWNGMTLTEDVVAAMGTSNPYCTNYQTLVYSADRAAEFEGLTSLEGLNIAVESGSAGEDAAGGAVAQGKTCAAAHGNAPPLQIQLMVVEAEDHLAADGDGLGAGVLYIAGQVVAAAG